MNGLAGADDIRVRKDTLFVPQVYLTEILKGSQRIAVGKRNATYDHG